MLLWSLILYIQVSLYPRYLWCIVSLMNKFNLMDKLEIDFTQGSCGPCETLESMVFNCTFRFIQRGAYETHGLFWNISLFSRRSNEEQLRMARYTYEFW